MSIRAYPLSWPVGWKRCTDKTSGKFKTGQSSISVAEGARRILGELAKMDVDRNGVVISSNLEPRLDGAPIMGSGKTDTGVAVYWSVTREKKLQQRCMAIDIYTSVPQNLGAVAATLEAMRAIERHGGAMILDRVFTGFAALPEHTETPEWRNILGLNGKTTLEDVKTKYRLLANTHHPDKGGDAGAFATITRAYEQAKQELT